MYKLLAEGVNISSLADYYEIKLRIILKNRQTKKVRRQTYVFETDINGSPKTQLDIWELLNDNDPYVRVRLNYSGQNITKRFYETNRKLLNFDISKKQIEIVKLRYNRYNNKQIAEKFNVSPKAIENHIHNLKTKIKDFYKKRNIDEKVRNMGDIIHFINLYGIFSFIAPQC